VILTARVNSNPTGEKVWQSLEGAAMTSRRKSYLYSLVKGVDDVFPSTPPRVAGLLATPLQIPVLHTQLRPVSLVVFLFHPSVLTTPFCSAAPSQRFDRLVFSRRS
jgi:hypothetical protein